MWELTKGFWFEAAHTLHREVQGEESRRIHGHSFRALVTLRGVPDPESGMLIDAALFENALETARSGLDHRLLDDVADLGPPTLENLCAWIWRALEPTLPNLHRIEVLRESQGERCSYEGATT